MTYCVDWDKFKPLFKTLSDTEIAEKAGVPVSCVRRYRQKNPFPKSRLLPEKHIKLLGTMPDIELAVKIGRGPIFIRRRRLERGIPPFKSRRINWDSITPLLGVKTDRELAIMFGVSHTAIRNRRIQLDVPAHRKHSRKGVRKVDWDENQHLLRIMADADFAAKFGISRQRVSQVRIQTGIPRPIPSTQKLAEALGTIGTH